MVGGLIIINFKWNLNDINKLYFRIKKEQPTKVNSDSVPQKRWNINMNMSFTFRYGIVSNTWGDHQYSQLTQVLPAKPTMAARVPPGKHRWGLWMAADDWGDDDDGDDDDEDDLGDDD